VHKKCHSMAMAILMYVGRHEPRLSAMSGADCTYNENGEDPLSRREPICKHLTGRLMRVLPS